MLLRLYVPLRSLRKPEADLLPSSGSRESCKGKLNIPLLDWTISDLLMRYRLMLLSLLSLLLLPESKGSLSFTFRQTMSSMVASRFYLSLCHQSLLLTNGS